TGKYPVILSDTLRGGTETDVFTAVRYNHKPQQLSSSDATTTPSKLKPATPGNETNFHLSLSDNDGGKYGYSGTRTSDSGQYVLYFDPAKKAFILDRINSTFHMNLTRTPDNSDPDALREQFQHLDTSAAASPVQEPRKPTATTSTKPAAKPSAKPSSLKSSSAAAGRKQGSATQPNPNPEKKKEAKVVQLALPQNNRPPEPPKPAPAPAETTKRDKRSSRRRHEVQDEDD
ncbi:hypothetical protein ACRALDRAFT_1061124, partial [Sodiomyces alcalophilus JCM 7366]|uniref:uncharacterized protein n=1 Tax=Sodiomyces alcalophilus JCM 7366 TaxID=591952 RepID=UPI0039B5C82F